LGIDAIGIWRDKIDDHGHRAAADLLFESRMRVSSVHWAGGFTGSDGRTFSEALEDACQAIQLSSWLGADCLVVHPGSRNGHTKKHALRLFSSALESLIPMSSDYGIRLAVEPVLTEQKSEWTFINGLDETLDLICQYQESQIGIVLDMYHVGQHQPVLARLHQLVDRIALVQLADRRDSCSREESRCLLGTGTVPIATWLRHLEQVDYRGFLEVELFGFDVESIDHFELLDRTLGFLEMASCAVNSNVA
jgi:sugar phosphate isomerase/epimerase